MSLLCAARLFWVPVPFLKRSFYPDPPAWIIFIFFNGPSITDSVNGFVRLIGSSLSLTVSRHLTRQQTDQQTRTKRNRQEPPPANVVVAPLIFLFYFLSASPFLFAQSRPFFCLWSGIIRIWIRFLSSLRRSVSAARLFSLPARTQHSNVRDPVCILGSAFKSQIRKRLSLRIYIDIQFSFNPLLLCTGAESFGGIFLPFVLEVGRVFVHLYTWIIFYAFVSKSKNIEGLSFSL